MTVTSPRKDLSGPACRITLSEFESIRTLMYDQAGIVLHEHKQSLVEARVGSRLRALKIGSYAQYLQYLSGPQGGREMIRLIDAISTNVTHFFRENDHFELLQRLVDEWLHAGRRRLRFWSAACSTGEEPYSLAMLLRSIAGAERVDMKILATDISTRALNAAVEGRYKEKEVAKIPAKLRQHAFSESGDGFWNVKPELREMIVFRRLNLNRDPYPIRGSFDAIFCRNVMIYFDRRLRQRIVAEAHRLLRPGGYLIIGHSETLIGMEKKYEFVQPSVYRKVAP